LFYIILIELKLIYYQIEIGDTSPIKKKIAYYRSFQTGKCTFMACPARLGKLMSEWRMTSRYRFYCG